MLNIKDSYATIWQVEDKDNFKKANISTSKKNKDGTYTNMSWKAKFVGTANVEIEEKQRIKITNGIIEVRKWEEKFYYDVVIFNFEFLDVKPKEQQQGFTAVVDNEVEDLPF